MNKAILIGRLTADPEITTSNGGTLIAKHTLAVDRTVKDANGERKADFIRIVAFGKSAEFARNYLHKGMKIALEGRINTGSYEKDGVKHYTTDIIVDHYEFCERKADGPAPASGSEYPGGGTVYDAPAADYGEPLGDDEALPF